MSAYFRVDNFDNIGIVVQHEKLIKAHPTLSLHNLLAGMYQQEIINIETGLKVVKEVVKD